MLCYVLFVGAGGQGGAAHTHGRAGQGGAGCGGQVATLMHTKDVFVSILYELIFLSTLQVVGQERCALLGLCRW